MKTFTVVLALIASEALAALPTSDLAGCKTFAKLFDNTCNKDGSGNPIAISNTSSWGGGEKASMSCKGEMRCPGASGSSTYTNGSPCTWTRALCVSCRDDSGTVKIRVQTNNLPNHCMNATVNNATEQMQDWEVAWMPATDKTKFNYQTSDFSTSSKTDEILCDLQRTSKTNMNAWSKYTSNTDSSSSKDKIGTQSGVFFSGGALYNSLAAGNTDAVEGEAGTLDTCLSHSTPQSAFHYHYWSGCAVKGFGFHSTTDAPALCKNTSNCKTKPYEMTLGAGTNSQTSYFTTSNYDKPIGIAKDGHMIIGPYKDGSSTRYTCSNRDVCNGAWVGSQYVYVASDTFPYTIGCWGPGPNPDYKPGCTTNGCGDKAAVSGAFELGMAGAALAGLTLF